MKTILTTSGVALLAASLGACAITPAPGAERVRVTTSAADVASCKPVGNINSSGAQTGSPEMQFRNETVGYGGDTLFVTDEYRMIGIAYRCAKD